MGVVVACRGWKGVLVLVFVAGAVGGCESVENGVGHLPPDFTPTTTPVLAPYTPPPPSPEPPVCPGADDAFAVTPVDSGLGHRATVVSFRNCGDQPRVLNGYPELKVLDDGRALLDVKVKQGSSYWGADPGAHPVTLAPGNRVQAIVAWSATVTDGEKITGSYLSVSTAAGRSSQTLPLKTDLGTTGEVTVTAWASDLPG
jgi:hypothetical protein